MMDDFDLVGALSFEPPAVAEASSGEAVSASRSSRRRVMSRF